MKFIFPLIFLISLAVAIDAKIVKIYGDINHRNLGTQIAFAASEPDGHVFRVVDFEKVIHFGIHSKQIAILQIRNVILPNFSELWTRQIYYPWHKTH